MNNSLVIGETEKTKAGYQIKEPFAMIPMEECLRLITLDIDLIGTKIEELFLTEDKVMYSTDPSQLIIDEYTKLLKEANETIESSETPEK
jgi:tetrahydromethanopterin S-methyltransferase subunit B